MAESEGKDCHNENGFDANLGVVDLFPLHGVGFDEGVAEADEGDAGKEGEEGGVGNAWGELLFGEEQAHQDADGA